MKGLIIAGGMGQRLRPLTEDTPKGLLEIHGTTMIENVIKHFNDLGITDIGIIVGYKKETIQEKIKNVTYFENKEYEHNNVLHSLMVAKDFMDDDLIVSYSDIWLERGPVEQIAAFTDSLVISVDTAWEDYYVGRTDHPYAQADKVFFDGDDRPLLMGKHLNHKDSGPYRCGEFVGLFKIFREFTKIFRGVFEELDSKLGPTDKFQYATSWKNAYLMDYFQELVDRGHLLKCSLHEKQWAELDTVQDYNNFIAKGTHGSI